MKRTSLLGPVVKILLEDRRLFAVILSCVVLGKVQAGELPILKFPKDRSQQLEALSKMQQTCKRWQRWYKRDRTESARVNMNMACRNAAKFADEELGIAIDTPKYAEARAKRSSKKSKPKATLLSAKKVGSRYEGRPRCNYWENQVDKIQQKLRGGYKEPQGNKLRQKRRNYWRLIRDNC